jgi:hypothetical protein
MTTQLMESFNLNSDDVVRLDSSENPAETTTSTHHEVMQSIWWAVSYRLKERRKNSGSFSRIFFQGVNGKVLRPDGVGGWLTGTVRVCLEFTPDEPENELEDAEIEAAPPSPLDDLRAELNLNNE